MTIPYTANQTIFTWVTCVYMNINNKQPISAIELYVWPMKNLSDLYQMLCLTP